jgi:hypothetical protein
MPSIFVSNAVKVEETKILHKLLHAIVKEVLFVPILSVLDSLEITLMRELGTMVIQLNLPCQKFMLLP